MDARFILSEIANSYVPFTANGNVALGNSGFGIDDAKFRVFQNKETVNSEDFSPGDILIGSNAAGQGNLYYLAVTGQWYFRNGTTNIIEFGNGFVSFFGYTTNEEHQTTVTSGNVQLDTNGKSVVRITSSSGNFTIQSIEAITFGQELEVWNDTTNQMTIDNNAFAGSPGAGYGETFTLTGAALGAGTYSVATFRLLENSTTPNLYQWMLKSYRSSAGAL